MGDPYHIDAWLMMRELKSTVNSLLKLPDRRFAAKDITAGGTTLLTFGDLRVPASAYEV